MSDLIATEVRPTKNSFGLPTGEPGGFTTEPLVSEEVTEDTPLEGVEPNEPEEEVVEASQEATDTPTEVEDEEDILKYALEEDDVPEVSQESELDRLRRRVGELEGYLDGEKRFLDRNIRNEAPEAEDEEELDFDNPQFRQALGEKLQESPELVPVLVKKLVDEKTKKIAQKLEQREEREAETAVNIEQQNRLKESFAKGLPVAMELGETEKRIVAQVQEAVATRDPKKSVLLTHLEKHPELANSPEGIVGAVTALARKAEHRARLRGVDITSASKPTASDRTNRMLEKQTKPDKEEDWEAQKIERMLATRKSPLGNLLKG